MTRARLERRWIPPLVALMLAKAAANAATAMLGDRIAIEFSGIPHAVGGRFELRVPAGSGREKALFAAGEIDLPRWMHFMLRRASTCSRPTRRCRPHRRSGPHLPPPSRLHVTAP
ncbi:hypothetical protein [Caballeronia arationis]|uniref:hypothetical protein n=1 Tax=Caballeronia arationis TaxID=1777142 RepID=UPI0007884DA2|nr:hypothetical protein [Caballeronia arationis]